jgi:hypothetical protein
MNDKGLRPHARFESGILTITFRDPATVSVHQDIKVVTDYDEFLTPMGVEIFAVKTILGVRAVEHLFALTERSDLRFGYDAAEDIAAIGTPLDEGSRYRGSKPRRATAGLDAEGHRVEWLVQQTAWDEAR